MLEHFVTHLKNNNKSVNFESVSCIGSPIHIVCSSAKYGCLFQSTMDIIKYLIAAKVNLGYPNKDGDLPIHIACKANNSIAIQELIASKQIDLNCPNKDGDMPIHIACRICDARIVQQLIDANVDLNCPNKDGKLPVHIAFKRSTDHAENILDVLIKSKLIDINCIDNNGNTLLYLACENKLHNTIKLLCDSNITIDPSVLCLLCDNYDEDGYDDDNIIGSMKYILKKMKGINYNESDLDVSNRLEIIKKCVKYLFNID